MPLTFLKEAIRRVYRCYRDGEPFINSWTHVAFPLWRPHARLAALFRSDEKNPHFSSLKAVMEIQQHVRLRRDSLTIDFLGLQPQLADFKLMLGSSKDRRQYLVQHKLDTNTRAEGSPLTQVPISRNDGDNLRWYFHSYDRYELSNYEKHCS